jgi:hypothetical protein
MKLAEIAIASHLPAEPSEEAVEAISKRLVDADRIARLTSTLEIGHLDHYFCLLRGDAVLGWLELGNTVELYGVSYDTVKFIYLRLEYRGTRVAGLFMIGLKNRMKRPLILGSERYGGVLFKDGMALVKAMDDNARFDVSVLNLKTGKITPLDDDALKPNPNLTLIFEEGEVPLFKDGGSAGQFYIFEDVLS